MIHGQKVQFIQNVFNATCRRDGLRNRLANGIFVEYVDTDEQFCKVINENGKIEVANKSDVFLRK